MDAIFAESTIRAMKYTVVFDVINEFIDEYAASAILIDNAEEKPPANTEYGLVEELYPVVGSSTTVTV